MRTLHRIARFLARRGRRERERGGFVIQPYRGYGTRKEIFLMGRILREPLSPASDDATTGFGAELKTIIQRLLRRGVPDRCVRARYNGAEVEVQTDRDGYFRIHLTSVQPPATTDVWQQVDLELDAEGLPHVATRGEVYVPPPAARFVVISDIDDTVMYTGVANKLKMFWRLFVKGAQSRTAFPGVGALYAALHNGTSGRDGNTILYVSRAPWGLYDVLDEFFNLHGIPIGPILFLREWGVRWRRPLPRRAKNHKDELMERMLEVYAELPVVLIGDSGQHDPEIYAEVVRTRGDRVLAVYIRDIDRDPRRSAVIQDLTEQAASAQSSLVLAADSLAMAEHAAGLGLIAKADCDKVRREMQAEREQEAAGA